MVNLVEWRKGVRRGGASPHVVSGDGRKRVGCTAPDPMTTPLPFCRPPRNTIGRLLRGPAPEQQLAYQHAHIAGKHASLLGRHGRRPTADSELGDCFWTLASQIYAPTRRKKALAASGRGLKGAGRLGRPGQDRTARRHPCPSCSLSRRPPPYSRGGLPAHTPCAPAPIEDPGNCSRSLSSARAGVTTMERPHPQYASGSSPQANSFTSLLGSREPDTPRASSSAESSSHLPPQGFPISLSSLPFRGPAASQSNRSSFLVGLDSLVFQSILTSVFSN
jgi:hypothetical protein